MFTDPEGQVHPSSCSTLLQELLQLTECLPPPGIFPTQVILGELTQRDQQGGLFAGRD